MDDQIYIVGYGLTQKCRNPETVLASSPEMALSITQAGPKGPGVWFYAEPRLANESDRKQLESQALHGIEGIVEPDIRDQIFIQQTSVNRKGGE